MRRRKFLTTGLATGIVASTTACGRRDPWRFFTADEAATLEALCACIIPEDQDPGATRAGVVSFIDTQLAGFYKPLRKVYREGISAVDQESGGRFLDLPPAKRIELLQSIERNPTLKPFFDLLVAHTMQGFYGDPRHGGNRDRASWKMLGLPYPPLRGRGKDSA